jgi:hypothetical protein
MQRLVLIQLPYNHDDDGLYYKSKVETVMVNNSTNNNKTNNHLSLEIIEQEKDYNV